MAGKRSLKRRLARLEEQRSSIRRDIGVSALEMYRSGELDAAKLGELAAEAHQVDSDWEATASELGIETSQQATSPQAPIETAEFTAEFESVDGDPSEPISEDMSPTTSEDDSVSEEFPQAPPSSPVESSQAGEMSAGPANAPTASSLTNPARGELTSLLSELEQFEKERQDRVAGNPTHSNADSTDTSGAGSTPRPNPIKLLEERIARDRASAEEVLAKLRQRVADAERRADEMAARAERAEREAKLGDDRVRTAAAEWMRRQAKEVEQRGGAPESEMAKLRSELEKEKAEKSRAIESAERKLSEIEEKALSTAERLKQSEKESEAQLQKTRQEADRRIESAEAAARTAAAEWVRRVSADREESKDS